MEQSIQLKVFTAEGLALQEEAVSVRAPGEPGYLGILANHAPLVTTLRPGTLTWRRPDGATNARRIGAGLLDIAHNRLTILTTSVRDIQAPASH